MKPIFLKIFVISVIVILFVWFSLLLAQKINLSTVDLGRHIKNGEIILSQGLGSAVLRQNFYSYTNPAYPFINHHWLSGVIFYFIHKVGGFAGLSWFYIVLGLATLWFFWDAARRGSNWLAAAALAALLLGLMAARVEVRPEMFTYLFLGVFYWILWRCQNRETVRWLWLLPILMLLWVNLHIGFILGFFILGAFGLAELVQLIRKKPNKFFYLFIIGAACAAAALINPATWRGLIYPFQIFNNYGYLVAENQSIPFLLRLNMGEQLRFKLFYAAGAVVALSFIAAAVKNWRAIALADLVLAIGLGGLAFSGIRHFAAFGFFALPVAAHNLRTVWPARMSRIGWSYAATAAALIILVSGYRDYLTLARRGEWQGLGLAPAVNASAEFFNNNHLAGPVFNNYDVGGYLIYHLYPGQQVFVDNRPEAYPVSFYQNIYIPAQEDEDKWAALDSQYRFNAIFFAYHDYTPWAQKFLIARVQDPNWAPVFADDYNIIFLRRNDSNAAIIEQFEIPKSRFNVVSSS